MKLTEMSRIRFGPTLNAPAPAALRGGKRDGPIASSAPLEAPYLSDAELRDLGRTLAEASQLALPGYAAFDFLKRQEANRAAIQSVYRSSLRAVAEGEVITPAAEWLLDNHYLVQNTTAQVRRDLPPRFFRQLPLVEIAQGDRIPRAMALAWLYAAHSSCEVAPRRLTVLVEGYQAVRPLQIGELWAIPSILRFVLIEDLARLVRRTERARQMRARANHLADRLAVAETAADCADIIAAHEGDAGDDAFGSQLLYRLSEASAQSHQAIIWLEQRLEERGSDAEEVLNAQQNRMSASNARIGNIVRSLKVLDDTDWTKWFVTVSLVDRALSASTDFAALDVGSQNQYRRAIEQLSRWSGRTELEVTRRAIEIRAPAGPGTASDATPPDIGFFLVGSKREALEHDLGCRLPFDERLSRRYRDLDWWGIAGPIALLTLAIVAAAFLVLAQTGLGTGIAALLALLAALPASEAATGFFNTLVSFLKAPSRLIGFAFKEGLPPRARTLVVVPCIIASYDEIDDLLRNLEVHYLSNIRGEIYFALLSDWPDSVQEKSERDEDLLAHARAGIARLAGLYGHGGKTRFFLLHRARLFNEREGVWMGWERKRGKLMELANLLRGAGDTTFLPTETPLPRDIGFVMTLDADTRLTRDAVTQLAGKLAHPLNHPVVDAAAGWVVGGYGVLQPRITPSLTTGEDASMFQRIFSISRGLDPYVFTVSDVYQDLMGEGSFTGKGLYHVDTFRTVLENRIPENAVLSHDLLEGSLVRCALVTDVELVEDFPTRYAAEAARQHRWARGDWQLLPCILGRAPGVGPLGRWKMIDNLRRTLVPIAWLAASVLGWCVMPMAVAGAWQAALVLSLFVAPTLGLIRDIFATTAEAVPRAHFRTVGVEIVEHTAQVLLRVVFVAHWAALMADAILRTLYRLYVSRRHLLEWRTALQLRTGGDAGPLGAWRAMFGAVVIGAVGIALALLSDGAVGLAAVFGGLWMASPGVAWWVSRPARNEDRLEASPQDRDALRKFARRTWSYFERFATAEHNWLPPDNFQEEPEPVVATRTSPTNIGLYLMSVVSARDFGWIGLLEAVSRLEDTVATLDRLEKHRGHLYNWYDTKRLAPLAPRYVSSVDSGNLAGHLIAVSATCGEWAAVASESREAGFDGILDVAGVVAEELARLPDERRPLRPLRRRLEERVAGFAHAARLLAEEPEFASIRTLNLSVIARQIVKLAQEVDAEVRSDRTRSLVDWTEALVRTCEAGFTTATLPDPVVADLRRRLTALRDRTRDIAFSMDFGFLMNQDRRLLAVGYRVDDGALDEACYDLLASEARLTSFFGIAKGDLPTEHWFRLGRPVTPVNALGALVSWSGSMFEYLMPPLVMQERQGGVLNQSNRLAVKRQMEYGRRRGIPWGVSESAFNARDPEMTYQYSNFGVPSLGLKRGLANDAVVAPYATILASQYQPRAAVKNLRRLADMGALGAFGFYDAVDFTPTRVPEDASFAVVRNFMAHHHGMSIVAISNVVFHGRLRERFHSDPVIEAAELLLQEKAPRSVLRLSVRSEREPLRGTAELPGVEDRQIADPLHHDPAVALLSNGHYSLLLAARGSGRATWNGLAVTRWRSDPIEGGWGTFLFLRDLADGAWWSASAEPRPAADERARAILADSKVEYHKTVGDLRSELEVIVASNRDAEGRRLTLVNSGRRDKLIEVTSYAEPVIGSPEADDAHPAFSKMFVRTELSADRTVIRAERNKRTGNEPAMQVAHLLVDAAEGVGGIEAATDRYDFIGRGRTLGSAAAFDPGARLSGSDGFTLDPVFALRRLLRVPAGGKTSLIFWTIAAPSRPELDEAVAYFSRRESFANEAMQAWIRSQIQLRHLGTTPVEAGVFRQLARYLVYPGQTLKGDVETWAPAPQSALWPMGISGDFPIMLLRIDADADFAIARKALRAQEFFRARGLLADLVIVNEKPASYAQDLQNALEGMCENARLRGKATGPRDHIFALRRDFIGEAGLSALMAAARVALHARNGTFSTQIERADALSALVEDETSPPDPAGSPPGRRTVPSPARSDRTRSPEELEFWNGFGGFAREGREYVVRLDAGAATPHPWINVVANGTFGFHVSCEGAGFTWSRNSRDYHLTPWTNDPVTNRPGEAFYVIDRLTGETFTPVAALGADPEARYTARHGPGISSFAGISGALELELCQLVDPEDPVKLSRLRITNRGRKVRSLRIYGYAEWVLGTSRDKTAPFLTSAYDAGTQTLTAQNPYAIEFGGRTAFFACDAPASSATASRAEFLGSGTVYRPDAVLNAADLSGSDAPAGDPCAALAVDVSLEPAGSRDVVFLLGDAAGVGQAAEMAARHRRGDFDAALAAVRQGWDDFLDGLQVETPDRAFDIMVNTWLPYQTLACRIRARSAFYQASGAFGFRDQLQDTLSLLLHDPGLARTQILEAAGRQFAEGDVQHWWLPESGAGVRTTISDDVVWLAYGVAQYLAATGEAAILDVDVPFLDGPELQPGEHDAFFTPEVSDTAASLFEHVARGLDLAVARTGAHGLSLMLGGDWNDGMNQVGAAGRGESVWLSWFLAHALDAFVPVAAARGETARAGRWRDHLGALKAALETAGWDGRNYRRGYYDDGAPLGSVESDECKIDSIAQSWSVMSGQGGKERANQAMDRVLEELVESEAGIIRLFTPPFRRTEKDPGYIKGYPPGVRENGGQYTHAAAWVVHALAELGRGDEAYACLAMLNPINHARDRAAAETYRVEPYAVAADIYSVGDKRGRGGWTWYTGSSGWLYRAAVEAILGIRRRGDRLCVDPVLPSHWNGFTARLKLEGQAYAIEVERRSGEGLAVRVNGEMLGNGRASHADLATFPKIGSS